MLVGAPFGIRRLPRSGNFTQTMTDSHKSRSPSNKKIRLGEVPAYLGVSSRVVERLLREGAIKPVRDPLDHRRKLVSVEQLDRLKKESLADD